MSLAIDVDNITHVLLADGWHEVHDASFGTDSYEFVRREGAGAGFSFTEGDHVLCGPLTSVLAIRLAPRQP
jgi:hypothetical protein